MASVKTRSEKRLIFIGSVQFSIFTATHSAVSAIYLWVCGDKKPCCYFRLYCITSALIAMVEGAGRVSECQGIGFDQKRRSIWLSNWHWHDWKRSGITNVYFVKFNIVFNNRWKEHIMQVDKIRCCVPVKGQLQCAFFFSIFFLFSLFVC